MKKALLHAALIVLGLMAIGNARAGEKTSATKETYLGLGVEAVPSVVYSQMPSLLPKGQGIMVGNVMDGSPAAKAGLHADDILLTYGNQKLHSPEQLVKLVRADKPAHAVELGYLRGGKSMTCSVTLGETQASSIPDLSRILRFSPDEKTRQMFEEFESKTHGSAWDAFDAIKLTRTDAKHWRAEVEFRGKDAKNVSKTYTGTREEIRKAIEGEKDLPANERNQLLRALNLHAPILEFHFPAFGSLPSDFLYRP